MTRPHRRIPNRCYLCGDPCTHTFCWAHTWADNPETQPGVLISRKPTPQSLRKLANKLEAEAA